MFLLHLIDKLGHFELIDSDFRHLYDLTDDELLVLSDEQYQQYEAINSDDITYQDGVFYGRPRAPSAAHSWDGKEWVEDNGKITALLQENQTKFTADIDEHAAKIYSTWTRFESEYRERQAAAEAFKAANYEGECSRYISDFAQRARLDNKTAANLILTQAAGLEKLQVELANQRMRKYELKAPNLTLEQLQSIHDDIIKQMDNLMEAYQNG